MVNFIPTPDIESLLPPLLACLPVAFASPRPPPALLPLLSPILRQRVQFLSANSLSSSESWLPLLCWESSSAATLPEIVQRDLFELHPISGEVEFGNADDVRYRRLDRETLQAKVRLPDLGLSIIYLWCQVDHAGGQSGWMVSEVNPAETDTGTRLSSWKATVYEAEEKAKEIWATDAPNHTTGSRDQVPILATTGDDEGQDDEDYWAQYDKTPARTPAKTSSTLRNGVAMSEVDYYAQYAQVQPAMDNDDPSEGCDTVGETSSNREIITGVAPRPAALPLVTGLPHPNLNHPRPSSSSSSSVAVACLENTVAAQSISEIVIRQHISTSLKSLFRLARGSGIEKDEFERLVNTELETLNLMGDDD